MNLYHLQAFVEVTRVIDGETIVTEDKILGQLITLPVNQLSNLEIITKGVKSLFPEATRVTLDKIQTA